MSAFVVNASAFSDGYEMPKMDVSSALKNIKFLNGDADGDGSANIIDATVVQKFLVSSISDPEGEIAIRGDVNQDGLDILDATSIQKYLANIKNPYSINTKREVTFTPSKPLPTHGANELPEIDA